jgi:hypothetical protein
VHSPSLAKIAPPRFETELLFINQKQAHNERSSARVVAEFGGAGGLLMKCYTCYFLTADGRIGGTQIFRRADDEDAKRRCRELAFTNHHYAGAEIWHGSRRVYQYPENQEALARGKSHVTASDGQ